MDLFRRSDGRSVSLLTCCSISLMALAAIGCASPGPPRAPSLGLPQPVRDLSVIRTGDTVELHFTAPSDSTDKLPLRGGTVIGQICRQLPHQRCIPVPSSKVAVAITGPNDKHDVVIWTDTLPSDLAQGNPSLLAYRVEFFNHSGRSAGTSAPAFTAAGLAPAPVDGLHAEGSRLGVVLGWIASANAGNVLLRREHLAPAPPKPCKPVASTTTKSSHLAASAIVWLETSAPNSKAPETNRTLDTTALPGTLYRYSAQRRVKLQLADRSIELRSTLSAPVNLTLQEVYPPLAPTGLTAVGFFDNPPSESTDTKVPFAVDLIWQPVDDTGLIAGLAGYNVYREPIDPVGKPTAARMQLNTRPIPLPSYHDTTANSTTRYRYSVTAIDAKGNESPAVTVLLETSAAQ